MPSKRNPREMLITQAEVEFSKAFLAIEEKYSLTYGEMFEVLGKRMARLASNLVEDERKDD